MLVGPSACEAVINLSLRFGGREMRSLQGLVFAVVAFVALKWEFAQETLPIGRVVVNTPVPFRDWILFWEAGVLGAIGGYLLITGEVCAWLGQRGRWSGDTFLAAVSFFLSDFSTKFMYTGEGPTYYLPPFTDNNLVWPYFGFMVLGVYFLIRGELCFWGLIRRRRNRHQDEATGLQHSPPPDLKKGAPKGH